MVNLKDADLNKMRVVDLRKELKSRGLACSGDKAELIARLEAAISESNHETNETGLDSPEIDSDGVLEEDDKSHNELLDDTGDNLQEELTLEFQTTPAEDDVTEDAKPPKALKRKITLSNTEKLKNDKTEEKETGGKKIVLNRASSLAGTSKIIVKKQIEEPTKAIPDSTTLKIPAKLDPQTKLEMRAKRFGLPVKMTESERKEARKYRFEQTSASSCKTTSARVSENIDKLKQRAERFGQSVSRVMTDIENKEKLEKRKAKFGSAK